MSVLDDRLQGLSLSLESASVEKSRQHELVKKMKKELNETEAFVQVRNIKVTLKYSDNLFSYTCTPFATHSLSRAHMNSGSQRWKMLSVL